MSSCQNYAMCCFLDLDSNVGHPCDHLRFNGKFYCHKYADKSRRPQVDGLTMGFEDGVCDAFNCWLSLEGKQPLDLTYKPNLCAMFYHSHLDLGRTKARLPLLVDWIGRNRIYPVERCYD